MAEWIDAPIFHSLARLLAPIRKGRNAFSRNREGRIAKKRSMTTSFKVKKGDTKFWSCLHILQSGR